MVKNMRKTTGNSKVLLVNPPSSRNMPMSSSFSLGLDARTIVITNLLSEYLHKSPLSTVEVRVGYK
jgi:hypothetical protein